MTSPPFPTGGRVKGAPIRALLEFWKGMTPREVVEKRLGEMPSEARRVLRIALEQDGYGILAGSWYPAVAGGALLDAVMADVPVNQLDGFVARAAESIMTDTLTGVHRAIFRVVGSPALMRDHGQTFWDRQFDSGRVSITDLGPGRQRHAYHDWTAHHPLICRVTFACVVPMFVAMGVKQPKVGYERCVARGGTEGYCSTIVSWTP